MVTISAVNGCDCPGTNPANGVLIDGVIPSIDTTQHGTWASELFIVNRNEQDSFMIGFEFRDDINIKRIEVAYLDCQIWGTGTSAIEVYSSYVFPEFIQGASNRIGELSLINDIVQSCISFTTVIIPTRSMDSSNFYVKFSFTGVSSVRPLNWLHLAEIRFSDEENPSTLTTTTTRTEYVSSSTASSKRHTTTTDMNESASGSSPLEPDDKRMDVTLPGSTMDGTTFTNVTMSRSSEQPSDSTDVSRPLMITSIVGGLAGTVAVLLLLLILGGTFIAYLVIYQRRNLKGLKSHSSLEHHYAAIGNPIIDNAPSLELQHLNNPGGEERRPSTAINSLYEPTTETNDHASSNTLSTSVTVHVPSGDVIYSEIRDILGVYDYSEGIAEDQAQDTSGVDFYDDDDDDDDDDIIHENHYTIIPEMYILAAPINQVKLNVRPKSPDVSQTVTSLRCVSEEQNQESYSLVHKQSECAPPVPEKSIELQQYLTVKMTAATEEKDQQKECRGQIDASENGTQTE